MNRAAGMVWVTTLCAVLVACGGGGSKGGSQMLTVSQTTLTFSTLFGIANDPTPAMVNVTNTGTGVRSISQQLATTIGANHPNGYEWCINMPAIDSSGNVYVNSEDGNIYVLPQGHSGIFTAPGGKMFLNIALGAMYTPLSIGPDGKLYTQNNGHLFVVGN